MGGRRERQVPLRDQRISKMQPLTKMGATEPDDLFIGKKIDKARESDLLPPKPPQR
jgi:hypothetical protein